MKRTLQKCSVCFLSALSLAAVGHVVGEMKEAVYPAGSRGVKVPFARIESQEQPGSVDGEPYAYTEPECVLSMDEQKKLQNEAVSAAEMCAGYYSAKESVNSSKDSGYASVIELTEQQRRDIVNLLGDSGMVSVSDDMNMRNYEEVENFYSQYRTGQEALVTIYEPFIDGTFSSRTFVYRQGILQTYYIGIGWQDNGIPVIQAARTNDITEIRLTEKGYVSYTVMITDWDSGNVEEILRPCMFEDVYRIHTGEVFVPDGEGIPAELYESIMMTYFPVTAEQLREYCNYDAAMDTYKYEMSISQPLPPFPEVVDYKENVDGTLTLFVDGVWPDYGSDYAFTNQIVVRPLENGAFRYLSNSIQKQELDIPVVGKR